MLTLRERILEADPTLRVRDIVRSKLLAQVPKAVRESFLRMRIDWQPNRAWGTSFQIGEASVKLGHRQGDHLASYPQVHGLTDERSEELLRLQVEGVLLHELGHAILDRALSDARRTPKLWKQMAEAALADGAPSTYRGHCVGGRCLTALSPNDVLHEMFAEAFRWWAHHDPDVRRGLPYWTALIDSVT